jgi:hypothetical protein
MLDEERKRVVFNFSHPIHMFGKWTPDYHYFTYKRVKEAYEAFEEIKNTPIVKLEFFISCSETNRNIVKKEAITTVAFREEELKIIFNMNYSITSFREIGDEVEISKFIIWNYDNEDDFTTDKLEILEEMKIIKM